MLLRLARFGRVMKRKLDAFIRDDALPPAVFMTTSTRSIQLTPREQQLRRLLLDVAKSINSEPTAPKDPVVLRWAGGWVRDKLLGVESQDIDVAINSLTGQDFAHSLARHCKTPAAIKLYAIGEGDVGDLHKVASNPDKSKHLETAMVKLFGLDLDFVNLRKETYTQDSRNPQMEFGTAEEDALRRDATINALFYNLHTEKLEDFTDGEADLARGVLRTPLEPFQTFMDDPLRVLRLIRFAARLSFTIDPVTEKCMNDPRVLDALKVKITRERVGVELGKMLKGVHPCRALELIDRLGLYDAVFTDPTQNSMKEGTHRAPDSSRWHVAYLCLDRVLEQSAPRSVKRFLLQDNDEAAYTAWNLAAVSPWTAVQPPPNPKRKENALPPVAVVAREGYKATNKLIAVMGATHRHHKEILELKNAVLQKASFLHERDRFGMAIRAWDAQGLSWRLQVLATMLMEAMTRFETWSAGEIHEQDAFIGEWLEFVEHLEELDVLDAPDLKPLVNGRILVERLRVKQGNWMRKALDICTAWQLRNPGRTEIDEAIEEVKKRSNELGITIPNDDDKGRE